MAPTSRLASHPLVRREPLPLLWWGRRARAGPCTPRQHGQDQGLLLKPPAAGPASPSPAEDLQPLPGAAPAVAATVAAPGPTRLQQQAEELLAVDVEYAHFRAPGQRRVVHLPAEVCLVDARGDTVLWERCNPLDEVHDGWRFVGGVPAREWEAAPPLAEVRSEVARLIEGRLLVGHNLNKDLSSLGITHPRELQRDTMRYRQLQTGRQRGQRLAVLTEQKLGRSIQRPGRRHDPREDALAALDLYLQHVHLDPSGMGYDDLVEHHVAEILATASRASGSSMDASLESDG